MNQTVKISKTVKSVPPKTGDKAMLLLYVLLFAGALGSMLFLVGKEYAERIRQNREDAEIFE